MLNNLMIEIESRIEEFKMYSILALTSLWLNYIFVCKYIYKKITPHLLQNHDNFFFIFSLLNIHYVLGYIKYICDILMCNLRFFSHLSLTKELRLSMLRSDLHCTTINNNKNLYINHISIRFYYYQNYTTVVPLVPFVLHHAIRCYHSEPNQRVIVCLVINILL